ncbi:MAG: hypothetical protein ABI791_03180 [Acidobacteriota bacterium]
MNVFEELVEELKDAELLEATETDATPTATVSDAETVSADGPSEPIESGFAPSASQAEAADEAEHYRQRAMDQVAGLQMVEHVMTGIEREYMKIVPAAFNDLKVKTALHRFLKVTDDADPTEHLEAEGMLVCETELWSKALAERDGEISVANVRRFCENSRPVLSSQALLALARFYRTSPGSAPVRAKFDFVMTRLFSRDAGDEKRRLLFSTLEMVEHIRNLYETWANLTPFNMRSIDSSVAETLVSFRRSIEEAQTADSFDELIASDYFNRTRLIKESAADMLFVPEVTAAAIECNVRIGNRFVELLKAEKANFSVEALEEKYGYSYDSMISGAASKTILLAELVKLETEEPKEETQSKPAASTPRATPRIAAERRTGAAIQERSRGMFAVNPWLLAFTLITIAVSVGVYFWSQDSSAQKSKAVIADNVSLDNSGLTEDIRMARSSNETFYGVVRPNWDGMTEQQQQEVLKKAQTFAALKGMRRVNLLNEKGRTVGYAAGQRLDILKQ